MSKRDSERDGTQGPADEGPQEKRARVEKRYNEKYVVQTLAEHCKRGEEDDWFKSWEEYHAYIAEEGEDDDWEKCLEHMEEMVKLIRDQKELIDELEKRLKNKDACITNVIEGLKK